MRLRNDSGYPLNSPDLGRVIDPGEEFEHDAYITGCTRLDPPEAPADDDTGASGQDGEAAGTSDDEQAAGENDSGTATPARQTAARTARSKGNQA